MLARDGRIHERCTPTPNPQPPTPESPSAGEILRSLGMGKDKVQAVGNLSVRQVVDQVLGVPRTTLH